MSTTQNPNTTTRPTYEFKERDKYGRTIYRYNRPGATTLGVIVRMPKTAIERGFLPYLCNNWETKTVVYVETLKAARAQMAAWA